MHSLCNSYIFRYNTQGRRLAIRHSKKMFHAYTDSSSEESAEIIYGDIQRKNFVDLRHLLPKDSAGKTPKNMEQQIDEMSISSLDSQEDDAVDEKNNKSSAKKDARHVNMYTTPPHKVNSWTVPRNDQDKGRVQTRTKNCAEVQRVVHSARNNNEQDNNTTYASMHQQFLWEVSCRCRFFAGLFFLLSIYFCIHIIEAR